MSTFESSITVKPYRVESESVFLTTFCCFVCLTTMSSTSEQNTSGGKLMVNNESKSPAACILCSKSLPNDTYAPYCSLKCAKSGVSRRYGLLRTFIDFETKYINKVTRVEPPPLEPEAVEGTSDTSGEKQKKSKK